MKYNVLKNIRKNNLILSIVYFVLGIIPSIMCLYYVFNEGVEFWFLILLFGAMAVLMMGGNARQAVDAASIALSNLLGLVCDPIAGLVEAPCQSRNAVGAANAITCAEMALSGIKAVVPFTVMMQAMYRVGCKMPSELRETALGGCAVTPTGCAHNCRIFGGCSQ